MTAGLRFATPTGTRAWCGPGERGSPGSARPVPPSAAKDIGILSGTNLKEDIEKYTAGIPLGHGNPVEFAVTMQLC